MSAIAGPMAAELKHEAVATRKCIERAPDDKLGWKPHDRSMTMGRLASHIVELVGWAKDILDTDHLNLDSGDFKPFSAETNAELLSAFDANLARSIEALEGATDERMMGNWKMTMGEKVVFDMPRASVMRSMVLNHVVHHRAQLSVFLRLNDIPVPAIYGPSADEQS